jgi:hypothetical protein
MRVYVKDKFICVTEREAMYVKDELICVTKREALRSFRARAACRSWMPLFKGTFACLSDKLWLKALSQTKEKSLLRNKKSLPLTCMCSTVKACFQGCLIEEHLTHFYVFEKKKTGNLQRLLTYYVPPPPEKIASKNWLCDACKKGSPMPPLNFRAY